ncbi:MAG: 23S rRNA (uracil(1939)-C(5))-methyltransferase RlmD [Chloroflexi bacterium AL-W]|nr:23S rRNA (uracil(1939)-C(5))-methyltransferase RlmD [Chloroflexi bacterium AL-N1]NOK65788.1 23S rRNA (uracil(1939)-C(5))-methyltransferase RlmD [Chloroflexi bacterium AL-N10]NOK74271.1 23S rRNA (uracil(1939)-C(5))-methyltransferase RlmD [Chloroflexi bacterium AL-N5]NOK80821.1 23S rRNA (uracil(1939)-C(5))-methyltransferase RlmD [Chloroflexi bacterium AL-W]NOK88529.1 23S rRNA (uracil(1939)-C(5))-methyltransferase RlmD [Chloroflexi bacterium AL-N15]
MTLTAKAVRRHILDALRPHEAIATRCPHTDMCGGCAFQDRDYAVQVAAKRDMLEHIWADDLSEALQQDLIVVPSPNPFEYRTRMDYVASKDRFGLRRRGKFNYIVELEECHLIPPQAFKIAQAIYKHAMILGLPDYNLRSHEGFLRYIVVRRSPDNELLLAAVTAGRDYATEMAQLAEAALTHDAVVGFHWLLNEGLADTSFGESIQHWGSATLPMHVMHRTLHIGPNTFFQNNVHLLQPLLDTISELLEPSSCIVDLYGGVGTIALHIAERVNHVTCVESVAESVQLAHTNISANGVNNMLAVESDVYPFLQKQFTSDFDLAIMDPPRIGLGPDVCAELLRLRPQRLIYVSCNPLTLLEDARALQTSTSGTGQYHLTLFRGYDMFPHTPHVEALAVFDYEEINNQ